MSIHGCFLLIVYTFSDVFQFWGVEKGPNLLVNYHCHQQLLGTKAHHHQWHWQQQTKTQHHQRQQKTYALSLESARGESLPSPVAIRDWILLKLLSLSLVAARDCRSHNQLEQETKSYCHWWQQETEAYITNGSKRLKFTVTGGSKRLKLTSPMEARD